MYVYFHTNVEENIMALLDNIKISNNTLEPPNVRIEASLCTPNGDPIIIFGLRFHVINKGILSEQGIHTLESFLVKILRKYIDDKKTKIIILSQMGNRVGFFLSVSGQPSIGHVAYSWLAALKDIMELSKDTEIPILNEHLGEPKELHSISEAQEIAYQIIQKGIIITNSKNKLTLSQ